LPFCWNFALVDDPPVEQDKSCRLGVGSINSWTLLGARVLSLQSERWSELQHAYGSAADVPALLERLSDLPASDGTTEPWFTLWSALAHQGDVYSASFAAVPHVVAALAIAPAKAGATFLQFPAWVEICRAKKQVDVPEDLKTSYFESLARLPGLVAQAANREWEADYLACALAAIAAVKGQHVIAEAVLEMSSPKIAEEFLDRRFEQ
jgi:hypothetical protein